MQGPDAVELDAAACDTGNAVGTDGDMSTEATHSPATTTPDYRAALLAFVTSPAAPKHAMSGLELDGYLTGVVLSPSLIPPSRWMAGIWGDDEPVFDDDTQAQSQLSAFGALYNAISTRTEVSLRRLEAEEVCDYAPAFQPTEGKPSRDAVTTWVRGFCRAMSLAPAYWIGLIEDRRTQGSLVPFIGFMEAIRNGAFEPAADIDERLDQAAAEIPLSILLLRKIADIRASPPRRQPRMRRAKVGRNDPCPCGSGKKFKRCCG